LYKLAIFDFDGTLVDSAPGIVDVMRQVVGELSLSDVTLEEWQHLVGIPLVRQMEAIFPDRDEQFRTSVMKRYRSIYDVKAVEICPPFPGLRSTLDGLQTSGVHASIVTSKARDLVDQVIDHHGLTNYFSLIIGFQEVSNHKPHPEAVHLNLKHHSLKPDEVIVIGDSLYDLDMARNAGVASIGVTTGIHNKDILKTAHPKWIVERLEDVLPLILNGRMNVA
jgi:phosphoglycolate phosphatase